MPGNLVKRRIWIDPTPTVHVALGSRMDLPARSLSWLERYSRSDPLIQYRQVCRRISDHPNRSEKLGDRVANILSRLDAMSNDQIERLDEARHWGLRQKPPPGVVPSLLMFAAALAVGVSLVVGGIQQVQHFSKQEGIGLIAAGFVVAVGLFILGIALYRRAPAHGLVRPPYPRSVITPIIILTLLILGAMAAASRTASYFQPLILIAIAYGVGRFVRRSIRSRKRTTP